MADRAVHNENGPMAASAEVKNFWADMDLRLLLKKIDAFLATTARRLVHTRISFGTEWSELLRSKYQSTLLDHPCLTFCRLTYQTF